MINTVHARTHTHTERLSSTTFYSRQPFFFFVILGVENSDSTQTHTQTRRRARPLSSFSSFPWLVHCAFLRRRRRQLWQTLKRTAALPHMVKARPLAKLRPDGEQSLRERDTFPLSPPFLSVAQGESTEIPVRETAGVAGRERLPFSKSNQDAGEKNNLVRGRKNKTTKL